MFSLFSIKHVWMKFLNALFSWGTAEWYFFTGVPPWGKFLFIANKKISLRYTLPQNTRCLISVLLRKNTKWGYMGSFNSRYPPCKSRLFWPKIKIWWSYIMPNKCLKQPNLSNKMLHNSCQDIGVPYLTFKWPWPLTSELWPWPQIATRVKLYNLEIEQKWSVCKFLCPWPLTLGDLDLWPSLWPCANQVQRFTTIVAYATMSSKCWVITITLENGTEMTLWITLFSAKTCQKDVHLSQKIVLNTSKQRNSTI